MRDAYRARRGTAIGTTCRHRYGAVSSAGGGRGVSTRARRPSRCPVTIWSRTRPPSRRAASPSTRHPTRSGRGSSRWASAAPAGTAMTSSTCAARVLATIVPKWQTSRSAISCRRLPTPGSRSGRSSRVVARPVRATPRSSRATGLERRGAESDRPGRVWPRPARSCGRPRRIRGELGVLARATRRRRTRLIERFRVRFESSGPQLPVHRAGHGLRRLRDDAAPDARDPRASAADCGGSAAPVGQPHDHPSQGQWSAGRPGHEGGARQPGRLIARGLDAVGLSPMATDTSPRIPLPSAPCPSAFEPCRRPASGASSTSRPRWTTSSASGWGSPTSTRRGSSSKPASRACARAGRTTPATSGRSSCAGRWLAIWRPLRRRLRSGHRDPRHGRRLGGGGSRAPRDLRPGRRGHPP